MVTSCCRLERIRAQVHAPKNLTQQVRTGVARLTLAEWTYTILVALGVVVVATLRTVGF